jgi:hypothetical protein
MWKGFFLKALLFYLPYDTMKIREEDKSYLVLMLLCGQGE